MGAKGLIDRWRAPALRAGVPEATVNKDSNPFPREDDIWPDPVLGKVDPQVKSVTAACAVQWRTQLQFRPRISALVRLHIFRRAELEPDGTRLCTFILSACGAEYAVAEGPYTPISTPHHLFCDGATARLKGMEPSVTAAIITSSVTFLSVIIAAIALGIQFAMNRDERRRDNESRGTAEDERARSLERADRERAEDADRRERAMAYSAFLVAQSARADAFNHFSHVQKQLTRNPFKKDTPEEHARLAEVNNRLEAANDEIDRTRVEAWRPLATMRLIASKKVLDAADAYDKALAASNPRRISLSPVPLSHAQKRDLTDVFIAAAREDLGRTPVPREILVSTDGTEEDESTDFSEVEMLADGTQP